MNAGPHVTVCIPSCNAGSYIRETVESVLVSTYSNLDIIVSDDASTDDTCEIVEAFGEEKIRLYRNERRLGVPKNWNRALESASGEFVGLLNHDDLYGPFWLTFAVHALQKHPRIGWVASAFEIIDDQGRTLDIVSRFSQTREYDQSEAFLCVARLDGLGPGYIARREILEEIGYYDENAGPSADNDLFLRLASRYPLYYSHYPHTAWRLHANNLTHRWGAVEQTIEGLAQLTKAFSDDNLPVALRRHGALCFNYFCSKTLSRAQELMEKGDLQTAQRLVRLLCANSIGD
jgi:glycosyltransferase involved in cell wall biosynthesis